MEIIERKDGLTLWRDRDEDRRPRYAATRDTADGAAVQPASCSVYSKLLAYANAREDEAAATE